MLEATSLGSKILSTRAAGSRQRRRRILLLSGAHAACDDFVALVRDTMADAVVERALFSDLGSTCAGESDFGRTRDAVFKLVDRHNITDVAVEWSQQAPQHLFDQLCDCLLSLKHRGIRVHQLSHFYERVIGRLPLHSGSAWALISGSNYHSDRRHLGTARDVRPHLQDCNLFVLPSYCRESIPKTILEAMSTSHATIACEVPGCREAVTNGLNGFLAPSRDPQALATMIERFIALAIAAHQHGAAEQTYSRGALMCDR